MNEKDGLTIDTSSEKWKFLVELTTQKLMPYEAWKKLNVLISDVVADKDREIAGMRAEVLKHVIAILPHKYEGEDLDEKRKCYNAAVVTMQINIENEIAKLTAEENE